MKKLILILTVIIALLAIQPTQGQITTNTLVAGQPITAAGLNTILTTQLGGSALNRTGGTITGNITVSGGITIDGIDIGAVACTTCAPTFKDLVLASPATGLTVGGNVIVNSTGKIPAISSTYFTSLAGTNLTSIPAAQLTGTVPEASLTTAGANLTGVAKLGATNTFTARNDFLTYTETLTAITPSASMTANLALGTHFSISNTTTGSLAFSNPPTSGRAGSFTVAVTGNGVSHPITWPAAVKWAGGTAPTITVTSGKIDVFTFITYDGGTSWIGLVGGQNF